jgi:hypothetical protein
LLRMNYQQACRNCNKKLSHLQDNLKKIEVLIA